MPTTMRFRIGPDGEITIASARPPIEDTALADKLVAFRDPSDHVAKPPFVNVTWVEVTRSQSAPPSAPATAA